MLESMGWQKGNGLGKNQQGNLDFIKVRYRNNASGLGFDNLKDNQWTENESNFDSLLKNLNSNSNSGDDEASSAKKSKTKSLEEMSKQSRARVHYKKFTRGKDVYKYSEKDLANILGKKTLKEEESKVEKVPIEDDSEK
jgi:Pin2-interacting protein X1